MTTMELFIGAGTIVFIIYAVFNIAHLVQMRKTSLAVQQFIRKTEEDFHPAVAASRQILEDVRKITENAAELSDSLRQFTDTIKGVNGTIRDLHTAYQTRVNEAVQANIAGLKAGVKTGVETLFRNINEKKE